jgi:hypothetical protein
MFCPLLTVGVTFARALLYEKLIARLDIHLQASPSADLMGSPPNADNTDYMGFLRNSCKKS